MAVLGPGAPERRAFHEPELRTAAAGLFLFSGQPLAKRWHEVVVRQLVIAPAACGGRRLGQRGAFGIGGCDQTKLAVQNVQDVRESLGVGLRFPPRLAARSPTSSGP